jgi:ATP-dependent helicase HrpB
MFLAVMTPLPIDSFLPQITQTLAERGVLVLVAEPGAGKTTRVPPAILRSGMLSDSHPQVVMLQPRRVAARAAAARIAQETGSPLGEDVGYHVRFDKRLNDRTRLRVLTEGILTRQLVSDPFLERIGCVVLDEFHERSLDVDLAIAFLREIRQSVRPDLKLVVMSATLDAKSVASFLGDAPIIEVPGRTYPVEIEYRRPSEKKIWDRVADEVELVFAPDGAKPQAAGDVLVFLPGVHEIQRSMDSLGSLADRFDLDVRPLHGSLSFDEQQRALSPSDRQRVILATNIAETSLTIDGVTLVIDSGLARVPRFDPKKGLDRLELTRISQASAKQRAGRAGRTQAGHCIRLWTSNEQAAMDAFELPEIRRVDLAPTVLSLRAWGTNDPRTFGWFDAPEEQTLAQAERLLAMLEAIDGERGSVTELGNQLSRLPVHPRIGRMLLAGVELGELDAACGFAAILSEKDFVRDDDAYANRAPRTLGSSDLEWRLQLLESNGNDHFVDRNGIRNVRRVREELLRITKRIKPGRTRFACSDEDRRLILPLLGFPDRVCRRREGDTSVGVMVGGGGVRLHPSSVVREGPFFLALDARSDERSRSREASVRIASRVESEWLETLLDHQVTREQTLVYEESSGKVVSVRRTRFHDLPIREVREGGNVDASAAGGVLAEALKGRAMELIGANEEASRLLGRLAFVTKHVAEVEWPHIDEAGLNQMLAEACVGKRSRGEVRIIDGIRATLVYPLDRKLEQFAPESIEVPTGSSIALDYSNANTAPVLAVRLQELFGLAQTPRIANGRVPVLLHLLGPNYRPVQVTDDLASFWKNTYPQVRKDLRARYPKHSWPEDPLVADAIRGPRRRGS